jgi:hypothetical protein
MNIESARINLGQSLIGTEIIGALRNFCGYDGALSPEELPLVERGLRAFLTGKVLIESRFGSYGLGDSIASARRGGSLAYDMPFGDHLLDYEFLLPERSQLIQSLSENESTFLERSVIKEVREAKSTVLPKWITTSSQEDAFFAAWFKGHDIAECEACAREVDTDCQDEDEDEDEDPVRRISPTDLPSKLANALEVARYLVGCQRAGAVVYADSRIAAICSKFIFQEWPEYLFSSLDEEYRASAARINGPGIFFTIPPLTKLVLSRAGARHKIPAVLVELRAEYARGRRELWEIIGEAYFAHTETEQRAALEPLDRASKSLFGATWAPKMDALSLALIAAPLSAGSVAGAAGKLLEHNKDRAQVAGVSFARRLHKDLRRNLLNSRELIKRHFSQSEQEAFGFI